MRKSLILLTAVVMTAVGAGFVFAANNEGVPDTAKSSSACSMMDKDKMTTMHNAMLDKRVKDGKLTAEQAAMMEETMKDMMKDMKCSKMDTMNMGDMGGMMDNKDCSMTGMSKKEQPTDSAE
ncbi:MAG: hypothetical protein LLG02_12835 [Pelosinus sp.]|nr:hypothetical protein [Pelosinus sp.]